MSVSSKELIDEVKALAEQFPDRKAHFRYVIDGKACCIVGTALNNIGVPLYMLAEVNFRCISSWVDNDGAFPFDIEFVHQNDAEWLEKVQDFQDRGLTWAESVKRASI